MFANAQAGMKTIAACETSVPVAVATTTVVAQDGNDSEIANIPNYIDESLPFIV